MNDPRRCVLLRALHAVAETEDDIVGDLTGLRLLRTVPSVRGRALQLQLAAERGIARNLHAAFPDELDEVAAALVGAIVGVLQVLLDDPANATPEGKSA